MGIRDLFGKKDVSADLIKRIPYAIKTRLNPYRLVANKQNSVTLFITLTNASKEPLLTSVVVKVPKKIGFDSSGLSAVREIRLGYLPPKESRELDVEIHGRTQTPAGEYTILINAFCHYRDYAHMLNSEVKKVSLRVV